MKFSVCSLMVLGTVVAASIPFVRALPESEASAGRLIARHFGEAVVGVRGTVAMKVKIGDRVLPPMDKKFDVNCTVIGAGGVTVTYLSGVDQKVGFEFMRSQMNSAGGPVELVDTEFKKMWLRMADGSEIPARLLWKDAEHDLALFGPEVGAADGRIFTFVDLTQAAESASVLGNYYHLSRANEAFQHVGLIRASTVIGIIERPRRLLLVSTDMFPETLGCPVFDQEGRVLGISLNKMEKGHPAGVVVVPAGDLDRIIREGTAQK